MLDTKEKTAPASCPECKIQPFTRNHYFTGKLLVERDFRQEQDYYINKLRLHAQRLHGWGVVCGLKVTQHENPACRDRFVCIEPGMALDCCGHDILVVEQDCVDLTQTDSLKALMASKDTSPHTLQICIRYTECPTEPIPVLYDDCGCDDTQCAPNRILESYTVDVIVDPQASAPSPQTPGLTWNNSINVAHASAVALHDSTHRIYILTDDHPGFVYQVSTDNYTVVSSHALGQHGLALAVSNDGTRVYAVAEGAAPGAARQLHVLDATQPGLPLIQAAPFDIPNSANSAVLLDLIPAPDNRLLAVVATTGDLLQYGLDINTAANPAAPTKITNLGANQVAFVLGSDGTHAYATDGTKLQMLVLAAPPATPLGILPAGAAPSALAVVNSSGGDLLAVTDSASPKLYLVNPATPSLLGSMALAHPPVALAVAADGRWGYVVELDTGKSYVEAVDLGSLAQGNPVLPGAVIPLGASSQAPVLSPSGQTLYVPFIGDTTVATSGGVAIVDVTETACCDLAWKSLDGCPACDTANCVVLATLKNYVVGFSFLDQTDPPADPAADTTNHVVRIDNHQGRRLLPSTSTLAEMIECICESGGGGEGKQGPPGQPGTPGQTGPAGPGIDAVDATFVTCDQPGSAQITMVGGVRTLDLAIPGCCNTDLAHICGINWQHDGSVQKALLFKPGLLIAFDRDVLAVDVRSETVHVLRPTGGQGATCWCEVIGRVQPVQLKLTQNANGTCVIDPSIVKVVKAVGTNTANGIQFTSDVTVPTAGVEFRVVINGDFIRSKDSNGVLRGADLDHLPGWLPNRRTGDGIEGGDFVSWVTVGGD